MTTVFTLFYAQFNIICNIINSPAPGIPNNPTKIEVIILRPI